MPSLKTFSTLIALTIAVSCGSQADDAAGRTPVAPTPVSYSVTGTVRDDAARPIEGVSVSVGQLFAKIGASFTAITDAGGRYAGILPSGTHQYRVRHPGFEDLGADNLRVTGNTVLNLDLRPGILLHGDVTEDGTGRLDGVKVEVISGPNAGRSTLTGGPGASGYSFGYLIPGQFNVRAGKDGYVPVEQFVRATVNTALDFTLRRSPQ